MATESFIFHKGINRNKSRILLSDAELYTAEGFDFEYTGMLMARDPKERGLIVDGPLLSHPGPDYSVPPTIYPWIPQREYLIGWYKFDEGSGVVVNNYAPDGSLGGGLLQDLAVVQNDGVFWTFYSGFGSTQDISFGAGNGLVDFAWANQIRSIGGASGACVGIFVRPKSGIAGAGGLMIALCQDWSMNTQQYQISNEDSGIGTQDRQVIRWGLTTGIWTPGAIMQDRWHFHFINNLGEWWVVIPNGTRTLIQSGISMIQTLNMNYIFAGCWYADAAIPTKGYYPGGCSYGDWIIYNQAILTDLNWAVWYDELRSRYSMSERSGW